MAHSTKTVLLGLAACFGLLFLLVVQHQIFAQEKQPMLPAQSFNIQVVSELACFPFWDQQDRLLYYAWQDAPVIFAFQSGGTHKLAELPIDPVSVTYAPDGRQAVIYNASEYYADSFLVSLSNGRSDALEIAGVSGWSPDSQGYYIYGAPVLSGEDDYLLEPPLVHNLWYKAPGKAVGTLVLEKFPQDSPVNSFSFTDDGFWLVVETVDAAYIWQRQGNQFTYTSEIPGAFQPLWMPGEAHRLIYWDGENLMWTSPEESWKPHDLQISSEAVISPSQDGKYLYYVLENDSTASPTLWLKEISSNVQVLVSELPGIHGVTSLAVSRDHQKFAILTTRQTLYLVER